MTTQTVQKNPSAKQLERDIRAFWFKHYPKRKSYSDAQRNLLAQDFVNEQLELWGVDLYMISDIKVYHPAYLKTTSFRKANVYDILADFMTAVNNATAEKEEAYPTYSEEQEYYRAQKRTQHELAIFEVEEDSDVQPAYTVSSEDMEKHRVVEIETMHVEREHIEDFIRKLKTKPTLYARRLQSEYGGTAREIARKIYKLDPKKIQKCKICNEWFYPKHAKTEVCDLSVMYKAMNMGNYVKYVATKQSTCWHVRNARKTRQAKGSCPI
ncbi:hypothetical protein [Lysinibacillus sp. GbtcB16]|uniref:hypothetical protein n=1 Tax=Lysinibacillus sp. GbtcB16 TaxID=2824761 RepID=UPI001C2F4D23|nr:hypothetical protein [Lysinibacillus sp. GbtcB16]